MILDMKVKSRFTCSNHETVELKILQEVSTTNIITVLALRTADFTLFRTYLVVSQRELLWKAKGPRRAGCSSRTTSSKHEFISMYRMQSQHGRKPAWVNRELLTELQCQKELHRRK